MSEKPSNVPIFFLAAVALLWLANVQGFDLSTLFSRDVSPSQPVVPAPVGAAATLAPIPTQDAYYWAGMLEGIGRQVASDKDVRTMFDVERIRDRALAAPLRGVSGGELIGQVMGPLLSALGSEGESLDEDGRRAKVVEVFLGVATALRR